MAGKMKDVKKQPASLVQWGGLGLKVPIYGIFFRRNLFDPDHLNAFLSCFAEDWIGVTSPNFSLQFPSIYANILLY